MDIESLHKCALDDRRELHQFAQDGLICQVNLEQLLNFFRWFVVSSKFLTTQLYCHIQFSLLWNLWFYIVKKLIGSGRSLRFVSYFHRGES